MNYYAVISNDGEESEQLTPWMSFREALEYYNESDYMDLLIVQKMKITKLSDNTRKIMFDKLEHMDYIDET